MKILKSQLFRQLTVLVLLIGILVSSVVCTQASLYQISALFGASSRTNVFTDKTDNASSVGDVNAYPIKYSSDDIGPEFDQLGFDILLGTQRDMVTYTGEIPRQWRNKEGLTLVPYSNYCAQSTEYWGVDTPTNNIMDDWNVEDGQELAKVEEWAGEKEGESGSSEVVSLRMYALTKASSNTMLGHAVSDICYTIFQNLCGFAAGILKIFISVKNVSVAKVLEALNLEKLVKVFTKVLIQDNGNLSIFMIIAIASFIFAIVGYAINFVRGNKKSSLKDILILAFCGFTVVGMCFTQNPASLGTSAANAVNKLTTGLVYDSVAGGHDIWESKAKKSIVNDSTEISYNETTLINKTLIELQILNQFGVQNIKDLDASNFKAGSKISYKKLKDISPAETNLSNFGDNLGYYYWFANSPSPKYHSNLTNTYRNGVYNSGAVDVRLSGIISYLQTSYNKTSDTKDKAKILSIIDHFANPSTANGALIYFLLTIEYVLLCLVLARLVLKILLAKVLVAGSVLGLPVAGPLLLTTRKKCVEAGKLILMVLVTYSIQIFVLSVIFDLVLNVIGVLITPNLLNVLLAMAVTVGLHAFLPNLYRELDKLFATINQSIGAGKITQYQRTASQRVSSGFNGLKGKTKTKIVTEYDDEGNAVPVAVEQHTGLSKAAAIAAAIGGYGEGGRGTNLRNIRKIDENTRTDRIKRSQELADTMHGRTQEAFDQFTTSKQDRLRAIYGPALSGNFDNIDSTGLSNEQDRNEYNAIKTEYDSILHNQRYNDLQTTATKIGYENMALSEQQELDQYKDRLGTVQSKKDQFNRKIQQDIHDQALKEHGDAVENAINKEVRTGRVAVDNATKNTGKPIKFKAKELNTVAKNVTDSLNKEKEVLFEDHSTTAEQKQLEEDRLSTVLQTANGKQRANVRTNDWAGTETPTVEGSTHEAVNKDVNATLKRNKHLFNKK